MTQRIRFIDKTYDDVDIDADTATESLEIAGAYSIAYDVYSLPSSPFSNHSIQLQGSITGEDWFDIGSASNVTSSGHTAISATDLVYKYYRLLYEIASGDAGIRTSVLVIK